MKTVNRWYLFKTFTLANACMKSLDLLYCFPAQEAGLEGRQDAKLDRRHKSHGVCQHATSWCLNHLICQSFGHRLPDSEATLPSPSTVLTTALPSYTFQCSHSSFSPSKVMFIACSLKKNLHSQ